MPTTRPFAYNTGSTISGTLQYGNIVVGVDTSINYAGGQGNVKWWNGPDEDLGYIITYPNPSGTQPNPSFTSAFLGFKRSASKTENSFLQLTNSTYSQSFTAGTQAKEWLNNNGYWTSYPGVITSGLIIELDAYNTTSYPGTGTTVNNLRSGSYNHTLSSAPYTVLNGVKCFDCNGASSTIISVTQGTGPTLPTSGYTYISWGRVRNSSSTWRTLFRTYPDDHPILVEVGTDNFGFYDNGGGGFVDSGYDVTPIEDVWVQYAVVGDSSSSIFYINGTQVGTTAYGAGGNTHWAWGAIAGQPFGYVANMYLYNRKLTITEIQEQYNFLSPRFIEPVTSNLVLYYDPSNTSSYSGTGTTVNDLSGNNLSGTTSNVTFTSPYFTFNGTSSSVAITDNSLLEPGTGDWTMEVWLYYSTIAGSTRTFMSKTNNGGLASNWSYGFRTSSAGVTYGEVGNGTTSTTTPSFTATTGTWYQVTAVWKNVASNSFELFVNGISQGSNSHSFASILNSTRNLYLGNYNGGEFSQWFNGRMGIVRLYNSALTSTQVLQNFNADKSKYGL